jgi:hypothetical protein
MNTSTVPYTADLAAFAAKATFSMIPSTFLTLPPLLMLDNASVMLASIVQPVYRSAVDGVGITYGSGSGETARLSIDGTTSSLSGVKLLM